MATERELLLGVFCFLMHGEMGSSHVHGIALMFQGTMGDDRAGRRPIRFPQLGWKIESQVCQFGMVNSERSIVNE